MRPDLAERIAEDAIRKYLTEDALEQFEKAREKMQKKVERLGRRIGLKGEIEKLKRKLIESGEFD